MHCVLADGYILGIIVQWFKLLYINNIIETLQAIMFIYSLHKIVSIHLYFINTIFKIHQVLLIDLKFSSEAFTTFKVYKIVGYYI